MKRLINLVAGTVTILLVILVTAFLSMRLAIHGREVEVPNFASLSNADAENLANKLGLNLVVENRFYSTAVPPNHVLSQSPLQGNRVRRGWQVRVTESLGGQRVAIPDVLGQPQRTAELSLRRLALDIGTIAHLPAPGPAGIVLAQSPPPGSTGAEGPRLSLLVADEPSPLSAYAFVMPSITGISIAAANGRLAAANLRITTILNPAAATAAPATDPDASIVTEPEVPAAPAFTSNSIIASQTPQPGHRVTRGEPIRVTVNH